ncbi:MAG: hypothetical protein JSS09_08070, partial [Verrucomicrobia bacterium]|nr:hypothetical protein [Verrucomicrobiota bacterium]
TAKAAYNNPGTTLMMASMMSTQTGFVTDATEAAGGNQEDVMIANIVVGCIPMLLGMGAMTASVAKGMASFMNAGAEAADSAATATSTVAKTTTSVAEEEGREMTDMSTKAATVDETAEEGSDTANTASRASDISEARTSEEVGVAPENVQADDVASETQSVATTAEEEAVNVNSLVNTFTKATEAMKSMLSSAGRAMSEGINSISRFGAQNDEALRSIDNAAADASADAKAGATTTAEATKATAKSSTSIFSEKGMTLSPNMMYAAKSFSAVAGIGLAAGTVVEGLADMSVAEQQMQIAKLTYNQQVAQSMLQFMDTVMKSTETATTNETSTITSNISGLNQGMSADANSAAQITQEFQG